MRRRERTRHLIELGGLIVKAELVDLTEDDRTVIFGLLLAAASALRGNNSRQQSLLWRRLGSRGFTSEPEDA